MRSILPAAIFGLVVAAATAACAVSAMPTIPPADAVGTIVAATIAATTPQVTATRVPPTPVTVPSVPSTQVAPTIPPLVVTVPVSATRINFLNGATTAVVSAPIQAGEVQTYVLQAFQAQPMLVNLGSLNNDVTLSIQTQGGTTMLNAASLQTIWQGTLPQTEDYYLEIRGGATTENFTLTVTIPSRIKFTPGSDSAKVTGKTVAGYSVAYTVFAIKSQKMSVQLANLSGTAALTIFGFADGQTYVRSASGQTTFRFTLPATQDYIIEVVPKAGKEVNYQMTVSVQ